MKRALTGLIRHAKQLGAADAKLIKASTVRTAAWVRMKCQFGCSGYGSNLCCPPHTPTPEQTQKVIAGYRTALLIHGKPGVDVTDIIVKLERKAFLAGYYKAFGFGAGPCSMCKTCKLKQCVHPEKTRPSMESCGIDVYATARAHGFPIEVVRDERSQQNYYGLLLIE